MTNVAPGQLTVEWEETGNHIGAPFSIALSCNDDTQYYDGILVAHLPHYDVGLKTYRTTIDIPDIDADCSLLLFNPMTDKIPQVCSFA